MSASRESVSGSDPDPAPPCPEPSRRACHDRVLICGVNWLGDSVMTMPAVRAFRKARPSAEVVILVKPWLAPVWRMQPAVDVIVDFPPGLAGVWGAARALSAEGCKTAYVFPNSFRSALVPFLAGVPERIGVAGHQRRWLLTRVILGASGAEEHQAQEYFDIMGLPRKPDGLTMPCLEVPPAVRERCRERLWDGGGDLVALIPGAAFGPAKRWPASAFSEVGRGLAREMGCRLVVLGSHAERGVCEEVRAGIGGSCVNFAGQTSLEELAGVLSLCRTVIANDNGGMHLAAAVDCRVVAVFGATDPAKTGPLGRGHRVVTAEGMRGRRDIERDSRRARVALESIRPERVLRETLIVLGEVRNQGEGVCARRYQSV